MQIDPQLREQWQARLETLQQLKSRHPEFAWLWDVRIQVLRYFCSRYGRQLPLDGRKPRQNRVNWEELPPLQRPVAPTAALPRVRSQAQLRNLLRNLHWARCEAVSDITARRE